MPAAWPMLLDTLGGVGGRTTKAPPSASRSLGESASHQTKKPKIFFPALRAKNVRFFGHQKGYKSIGAEGASEANRAKAQLLRFKKNQENSRKMFEIAL